MTAASAWNHCTFTNAMMTMRMSSSAWIFLFIPSVTLVLSRMFRLALPHHRDHDHHWTTTHVSIIRQQQQSICEDDLDCSLNGICNTGSSCTCDTPWSGFNCDILEFQPTTFPQGYGMAPNVTATWGGGILVDPKTNLYHLYVVRMTNNCTLENWTKNSRIDHAVSKQPTGPYSFTDVAIPTQSHNPVPLALPDGTYAIMHIGSGDGDENGGANCSNTARTDEEPFLVSMQKEQKASLATTAAAPRGSTIHVSTSLYGPWRPLRNHTLGFCNNPAPFVHPNGTIFVGCRFGKERAILKRAESIAGPYTDVTNLPTQDKNGYILEDPQLYVDFRGHFHGIYHAYHRSPNADNCENEIVSTHIYSKDGHAWHISQHPPYGTKLELASGESITLATRERPKPLIDENGIMTHIIQAVCGSPYCYSPTGCVNCKYKNWDFTLVSALGSGAKKERSRV